LAKAPQHGPSALFDRSSLVICFSLLFERPLQLLANAAIAASRVATCAQHAAYAPVL